MGSEEGGGDQEGGRKGGGTGADGGAGEVRRERKMRKWQRWERDGHGDGGRETVSLRSILRILHVQSLHVEFSRKQFSSP